MSRTLTRLRAATGDPLLVRAGRGLVPTPARCRTARSRSRAHPRRAGGASAAARAPRPRLARPDLHHPRQRSVPGILSAPVVAAITAAAPRVRLRFAPKPDKDAAPLREGLIDLEIGVLGTPRRRSARSSCSATSWSAWPGPGIRFWRAPGVTPERYAACGHVVASREGDVVEPVDDALEEARTAADDIGRRAGISGCDADRAAVGSGRRSCRAPASATAWRSTRSGWRASRASSCRFRRRGS